MTTERRFEQDLPELLTQLGLGPAPDYRDDIVRRTASIRQRPAWTLPERWFSVSTITTRVASPPRAPLRLLAVAALLILAIAAVLIYTGSRSRVPAPFGVAANGLIAYSSNGDIYTVDPATGRAADVVAGTDQDIDPVYALDGRQLLFERRDGSNPETGRLVVSDVDGSHPVLITPDAVPTPANYSFSPDGRLVAFMTGSDATGALWIARADGSQPPQKLDIGLPVQDPVWGATDRPEILFTDYRANSPNGLYAYDVEAATRRTILAPMAGVYRDVATVSPDGSRIAYSASDPSVTDHPTYVIHVAEIDGSHDVALPMPETATFQDRPVWSNDSTRLAVARGYALHNEEMAIAVVPADGNGTGIETAHGLTGCCDNLLEWAPADTSILFRPDANGSDGHQILIDPATGHTRPAPWAATSIPAWQRLAP